MNAEAPWTATFTGKRNYMMDPERTEIVVADVAHQLATKSRWNGASREPIFIAQHSVMVALLVKRWGGSVALQLLALFHDAGEAYTFDLAGPYKAMPEFAWFVALERRWLQHIVRSLGIVPLAEVESIDPNALPEQIRLADEVLLQAEAACFMPLDPYWVKRYVRKLNTRTLIEAEHDTRQQLLRTGAWSSTRAESEFLQTFTELVGDMNG